jgi:tRNA (5-methylaminomethyl-2-thiouridylate)-methyltransferase
MFFCICYVKYHMFLCFYVFGNAPVSYDILNLQRRIQFYDGIKLITGMTNHNIAVIVCHVISWLSGPLHLAWAFGHQPLAFFSPLRRNNVHVQYTMILKSAVENDTRKNIDGFFDDGELTALFVENKNSSIQYSAKRSEGMPAQSIINSVERVRKKLLSISDDHRDNTSNDEMLKRIVQEGIKYQQKHAQQKIVLDESDASKLSHGMEKVSGCIATVYLRITLIPLSDDSAEDSGKYRVILTGTADAMLSGGLLAILAETISGGFNDDTDFDAHGNIITSDDILNLNPETLTNAMGLQSILSRGRNDGVASMVRVIQRQIMSLVGGEYSAFNSSTISANEVGEKMSPLLNTTLATIHSRNDGTHRPSVAMLLSGGVDSSVALHLLLRQNYNVTAFYLRIWLEDELAHLGECPWEEDLKVCRAVCEHAGNVPLETVSLGDEYRERVIQYTIEEAQRGRTPNPDIMCNSRVKFGCFLEYIEKSGTEFDYIASGHYARLVDDTPATSMQHPKKRLFRAPDPIKDQSYFLCALTQHQLSNVLFPIGAYQKSEVRELATRFQLPNRNRPDSQGLCFLGKVRFDDFIASYLGKRPGDVIDALNGVVIGRHNGLWYHTVGQRKGIGKVLSPLATARGPW